MKSMVKVIKELYDYFYLIRRLSVFEVRSSNANNYLGLFWEILKPAIFITIYAVIFGAGIRGGEGVNGIAFLPWLLAGINVWFFFNESLTKGTASVFKKANLISKMNFPMSAIPAYTILSRLYSHIGLVIIVAIILWFMGFPPTIYLIQLPLYTVATIAVLTGIDLITSTLATVVRDVYMFITSSTRLLLYTAPILWAPALSGFPTWAVMILKLNPLYYVVASYRSALLGESWYFLEHLEYTAYFCVLTFFLLLIGSMLHLKFRSRFVEYI